MCCIVFQTETHLKKLIDNLQKLAHATVTYMMTKIFIISLVGEIKGELPDKKYDIEILY